MRPTGSNGWRQLAVCAALLLTACGSVTYKRGASPDSMAAAEAACRTEAQAGTSGFAQCMRGRGWFVAELDADAGGETPHGEGDAADESWFARRRAAQTPTPATDTAVAPAPVSEPVTPTTAGLPAASAPPLAFDPMAPVAVGSWWKFGGSAGALDGAVTTCVAELGNAHRPDPALKTVTAGLRACLRADGWYALGR